MSRSGSSDLKTEGAQQDDAAAPRNASIASNTPMSRKKRGSLWDKKDVSTRDDGKIELKEDDAYDKLGFKYSNWKKWTILSVIFIIQCSMNFNASVYGNCVKELAKDFKISTQAARSGQGIFLVAYAFGCELWAPWSEEFGRKPILQASLLLVNIWQIPCALAPNIGTIVVCRFLGGISSAGGSVTLGMVADMWEPDDQQYAVAFIVLSSVGGSVLGPLIGAFSERNLSWHWIFWVSSWITQIHHSSDSATAATYLRRGYSTHPPYLCPGNANYDFARQGSQETAQRRKSEHLRTQRDQWKRNLYRGSWSYLDPPIRDVCSRANCALPLAPLWIQRCSNFHIPGVLHSRLYTMELWHHGAGSCIHSVRAYVDLIYTYLRLSDFTLLEFSLDISSPMRLSSPPLTVRSDVARQSRTLSFQKLACGGCSGVSLIIYRNAFLVLTFNSCTSRSYRSILFRLD